MHLYDELYNGLKKFGYIPNLIEDSFRNKTSNIGLIYKSIVLSILLKKKLNSEEVVAIMLPNAVATVIIFFALQYLNKTVSIINFTSGIKNIKSSLSISKVKKIITSRTFIEQAEMQDIILSFDDNIEVIYIEDVKKDLSIKEKLKALVKFFFKEKIIRNINSVAVILYTSGTESSPKGVMLSHKNLFENRKQVLQHLNINKGEKFFTCLPFFHSFGLGVGILLPILNNLKLFLYPTPLHYKTIPTLLELESATVFFSTDTFLKKYASSTNSNYFQNLKFLIAGAEKLDPSTYDYYLKNFNIKILEGYGVTEASPAVSVNTYENFKLGSVGKLLPGIEYKIEKIEGYEEGGLLFLKGKNIMLGYQLDDSQKFSGVIDGWYNTGDVAKIDDEGYLFILGRLKRFAKIAGEMISLAQVEDIPKKKWPDNSSAVCAIKDSAKGEALILITDNKMAKLETIIDTMKNSGFSSLYYPKKIKIIHEFPILGSGKINFKKLQEIAES